MRYEYDDEFLTRNFDDHTISQIESKERQLIIEKITCDEPYVEELTKCRVYMQLARMIGEAEGAKDKYDMYKTEYERYLKLATNNEVQAIGTIKIWRR